MANIMAETDTYPRFSRLTEGRKARSWKKAIPAVVVVVAFLGLLAYLASSLSSSSQKAMAAEREAKANQEQMAGLTKQISGLQKDDALAKSPGRTTVLLEPPAKKAAKGAPAATPAWAAVVWGELPDGKTFARVNAYGLLENREEGKDFHAWFVPQTGDPVDMGALEVDPNGSGFAMITELPAVDQGKSVLLTADPSGSKQPGTVLAKADLPKLTPTQAAPGAAPAEPQAKSGTTSQQMHQQGAPAAKDQAPKTDDAAPKTSDAPAKEPAPLGK
jgi:hypothetical protein